ncbi:hypothetical protein RN001_002024 [Aquatica leii]|uniref:Regulatory protein zeste n=1 Tax=Aquatica leii TaxID=1421715 RepID=A0AAN7QN82_9COLE|nr:hypothetical protein RN001_002024 [Aquatica leii]
MAKREKCKNYSEFEKTLLLDIVKEYQHLVENKCTDAVSAKSKNDTWEEISYKFNASSTSGPRTAEQIKNSYRNLKQKVKKEIAASNKENYLCLKEQKANDKKELYKTGGGVFTPQLSNVGARVLAMVENQIKPLPNPYDDNVSYHDVKSIEQEQPGTSKDIFIVDAPQEVQTSFSVNTKKPQKRKFKKRVVQETTAEQLKKTYFKKKNALANYQLWAAKREHNIDMKIKNLKLRYWQNKVNSNN